MSKRNQSRTVIATDDELYEQLLEQRDLKRILHYSTPILRHPTVNQRANLQRIRHLWTTGDSLQKLSYKYYGDPKLWWIIAWYNGAPTDAHYNLGNTVFIPKPLSSVLAILRSY